MTFIVKISGAPRPIRCDFRCPVHGVFTALVDSNANDSAPCPTPRATPRDVHPNVTAREARARIERGDMSGLKPCGLTSLWSPSPIPMRMRRVEATRGNHEKPQHKGWLDSSNLEEGQEFDDWQADRDAVDEELRKELVMEMVKTDR